MADYSDEMLYPRKTSFTQLKNLLDSQLDSYSKEKLSKTFCVQRQWHNIVGPLIARHSKALYIKQGCLIVTVTNPSWHNELIMMKDELLAKIQKTMPDANVTSLKFKISSHQ
jgi:predicted nucleic acid-binding Zn ribbon protein